VAFLAPLFLGLAALAGVPLLVHLLRRKVGRVVDFPAVRYLLRMEREHSKERKLKNRLLLLLRLLAVVALALAAARPVARLAGLGHAPVAVAIVLDNSMSSGVVVGGKSVLDALRADARELVNGMTAEDRGWLVTADGKVASGAKSELQTALDGVRALAGRGDVANAIRRGTALAIGGKPRAPVVAVVTDGQQNAFGGANDSTINANSVPVVVLAAQHAAPRNRAVLSATPEPARWTPTGNVSALIMSPDSAAWRVSVNGRMLARGTAPPGDFAHPSHVDAHLSSASQGWLSGTVELDADELRADDIRYFAVRVAPPPFVDVRPEAGPFLSAALGTLTDDGRIARPGGPGPAGLSSTSISRVTVSSADASGLTTPFLLVAPSDPLRVGDANRTLERLGIPWRFGALLRDTVVTRRVGVQSTVTVADSALEGTRVMQRYPLQLVAAAAAASLRDTAAAKRLDTLAMTGGTPWVVAGPGYVLVGSPVTPVATDLPLRPAFVPWLFGIVAMRLGDDGQLISAVPGARISLPSDLTGLEMADGSVRADLARSRTAPAEAGVYLLRRDAARVGALVVNAEPEESDLTAATGNALLARISGSAVSQAASAESWRTQVLNQAAGRSLSWPLIALALLALILESWISRLSATAVIDAASATPAPRSRAA
jgi:hypothetical protein